MSVEKSVELTLKINKTISGFFEKESFDKRTELTILTSAIMTVGSLPLIIATKDREKKITEIEIDEYLKLFKDAIMFALKENKNV